MSRAAPETEIAAFLRRADLLQNGDMIELTALTGGVSSDLWKVDLPTREICVKRALSQLKVAGSWFAPVDRNHVECEWLRFAGRIQPGHAPEVLAEDVDDGLFAMEYLAADRYPVWKTQLLDGQIEIDTARQVGDVLGRLHAASAADHTAPARFATDDNFVALRIDPYLTVTADANRDLAPQFAAIAERTMNVHYAVVHGDVSPKNILVGAGGPVLLDAECAWFGDPAFDVAFCVNHLLIKAIKLPRHADTLSAAALALADAHAAHVTWEPYGSLNERVASLLPALGLARVDGSSPVEYLDGDQRATLRSITRELLMYPAVGLPEVVRRWTM
jgi:aminoglycoside phosphotransferase (APT) family kinase protein